MAVTKADLFAAFKPAPVPVEIDGQCFHVRPLLVADMLAVNAYRKTRADGATAPMIFARGVCDAAGNRLFEDGDAAAIEAGIVGGVVDAVTDRVMEASRLG